MKPGEKLVRGYPMSTRQQPFGEWREWRIADLTKENAGLRGELEECRRKLRESAGDDKRTPAEPKHDERPKEG